MNRRGLQPLGVVVSFSRLLKSLHLLPLRNQFTERIIHYHLTEGHRGTSQGVVGVPPRGGQGYLKWVHRGTSQRCIGVPKRGVAQPYFAFCHLRESFLPVGIASLGRERKGKIPSVDFVRFVANNHQVAAVTRDA